MVIKQRSNNIQDSLTRIMAYIQGYETEKVIVIVDDLKKNDIVYRQNRNQIKQVTTDDEKLVGIGFIKKDIKKGIYKESDILPFVSTLEEYNNIKYNFYLSKLGIKRLNKGAIVK